MCLLIIHVLVFLSVSAPLLFFPHSFFVPTSQSMKDSLKPLLQRKVKLKFLQLLAPGIAHPSRSYLRNTVSPVVDTNRSLGGDGLTRGKKFRFEDVGLASESIETFHYFMYPGLQCVSFRYCLLCALE